ncbi:hypothetical protein [Arthrobacter monumenti]
MKASYPSNGRINKLFWLIPVALLAGAAIAVVTYFLLYAGSDPAGVAPGMAAWHLIGGAIIGAMIGAVASTVSYFVLRSGQTVVMAALAAYLAVGVSAAALHFASSSTGVGFPLPEVIIAGLSAVAAPGFILIVENRSSGADQPKTR